MAIKKSQLYSTLWESCNNLRGGMDASLYKDYVLMVLFLKYLSDKDRAGADLLIEIPEGCHFEDIIALKEKTNIGEGMNIILSKLGEANPDYAALFQHSVDFCDEQKLGRGKDLVKTLTGLVSCFQRPELDFGGNNAADDDLIGDAYEYLMKNFASQSGKSKGQFYTPAEVSVLMALLIGINKDTRLSVDTYDPTSGSCSLLLRGRAMAHTGTNVSLNGQEMDVATVRMATMNMIIHGVETPDLRQGDTLNAPLFVKDGRLMRFDYVLLGTNIYIPNGVAEQRAIAHVLSTMDSEISALEKKRKKYRQIKQGMMRDLLTGRIRLVENDHMERKCYSIGLQNQSFDGAVAAEPSPQ